MAVRDEEKILSSVAPYLRPSALQFEGRLVRVYAFATPVKIGGNTLRGFSDRGVLAGAGPTEVIPIAALPPDAVDEVRRLSRRLPAGG